jgi:VWFA-related protein
MFRYRLIGASGFLIALAWLGLAPLRTPAVSGGQKKPETVPVPTGVIKSEASLVLVDVVVTDKKKHVLKDLTQKDFHVFEDGAERNIVSFSREGDIRPDSPGRQRYMVLFFDNSSTDPEFQMVARDAARNFVEMTASPNRMMSVVDFDNGMHVAQNFTANGDLLNDAVQKVRFAALQTNASSSGGAGSRSSQQQAELAVRNLLRAIREVAQMLGTVQGRKVMIFLSYGFTMNSDLQPEFDATLDALNKANVGVYPVGAMGLAATGGAASAGAGRRGGGVMRGGGMATNPGTIQQIFNPLASHTGGFPIVNTNDLAGGMQRVSEEMNESYILGYVPPNPTHDGRYHKIRVKVDRTGTEVRARDGYFDLKSPDLLAGKPEGNALESHATSFEAGEIPLSLTAPYFYVRPGVALVNLALSIPGSSLEFAKQKGALHAQVNVLGIAYRDDGSVAARFSDAVNLDYDKDEEKQATKSPFEYQKCFKIAPGSYLLKVVLSAGGKFGKYVRPLEVDPFSGKEFILGGPEFSDKIVLLAPQSEDTDENLLENTKLLIANGVQVVPSSSNHFAKNVQPVVYVELYDPLLKISGVKVGILFKILENASNRVVYSSDTLPLDRYVRADNPLVPVSFKLPMDKLPEGKYRLEIWGRDSAGNISDSRTGNFSIE